MEADKVDAKYKRMRLQVFLGIFIGYAGFYIVRKNFSMAIPELALLGFDQSELSIVLAMNAVAYALSKFLMGSVSDRSNARVFLPLGLVLAALSMMFMIVPVTLLGPEHKRLAIFIMAVLNFLVGHDHLVHEFRIVFERDRVEGRRGDLLFRRFVAEHRDLQGRTLCGAEFERSVGFGGSAVGRPFDDDAGPRDGLTGRVRDFTPDVLGLGPDRSGGQEKNGSQQEPAQVGS